MPTVDPDLALRQEAVAHVVLDALDRIGEDLHTVAEPGDLRELISRGESDRLEFKSSLRFPHEIGQDALPEARKSMMRTLEETVAKVLASFLNARGGTLLIGVRDDGEILGIEHDLATLGSKASLDGWELHFKSVMSRLIGSSARTCTSTRFVATDRGTVAVVRCSARTKPTWLHPHSDQEAFWVRSGNANQKLSPSEALGYIQEHWGRAEVLR